MNLEEIKAAVQRLRARREELTKLKDYRPMTRGQKPVEPNLDGLLARLASRQINQEEGGDSSGP